MAKRALPTSKKKYPPPPSPEVEALQETPDIGGVIAKAKKGMKKVGDTAKNVYGAAAALAPGNLLRSGLSKAKDVLDKASRGE